MLIFVVVRKLANKNRKGGNYELFCGRQRDKIFGMDKYQF
jgi:hypothetical protein